MSERVIKIFKLIAIVVSLSIILFTIIQYSNRKINTNIYDGCYIYRYDDSGNSILLLRNNFIAFDDNAIRFDIYNDKHGDFLIPMKNVYANQSDGRLSVDSRDPLYIRLYSGNISVLNDKHMDSYYDKVADIECYNAGLR